MAQVLRKNLSGIVHDNASIIDICPLSNASNQVALYLTKGSDLETVHINPPWAVVVKTSIDGAPIIIVEHDTNVPVHVIVDGHHHECEIPQPDIDLFKGRDTILAIRNGETPDQVLEWIKFHHTHHGMSGAVIVDRASSETADGFADALSKGMASDLDIMICVVSSPAPLGAPDTPPEQHPFCAPNAPGKDRMTIPAADPFSAPLNEVHIFEICRHRFLATARSVANIDVYEMLTPTKGTRVFDHPHTTDQGIVTLLGQMCYPWRIRKGSSPSFSDHICVQFDQDARKQRWCIAPEKLPNDAIWKFIRVVGATAPTDQAGEFLRFMALRHPAQRVSKIVPKTSLIEDPGLLKLATDLFGANPIRVPDVEKSKVIEPGSVAIVTTMKNEGPFILEWLAYHRVIGVNRFLVYTNDCTDGTDQFFDLLQEKGYVQHRENPFKGTNLKPQHAALQAAETEEIITSSDWAICMDVDEYINVKIGDGMLADLFAAVPDANMISLTWRLFGNDDVHAFDDSPIIGQFSSCAEEMCRKPHQAWGFKTLHRNIGLFKKLGVHRPKGLKSQLWEDVKWVNGSGKQMPREMFRNAWRSTAATVGYDLVQLNHYAVRSAESFLVKRDRGRVNHVDRDQGLAYWFRMNHNAVQDTTIQRLLPKVQAEMDALLADPDIAAMHHHCVTAHKEKIAQLRATENYSNFYAELTGARMEKLSKILRFFGANVFLGGPEVIPDDVIFQDHPESYFFTVKQTETKH